MRGHRTSSSVSWRRRVLARGPWVSRYSPRRMYSTYGGDISSRTKDISSSSTACAGRFPRPKSRRSDFPAREKSITARTTAPTCGSNRTRWTRRCSTAEFSAGNRIEFGRVENRNGWFVSIYQQRDQTQDIIAPAADMVFNDPPFGPHGEPLAARQREQQRIRPRRRFRRRSSGTCRSRSTTCSSRTRSTRGAWS